MSNITNLKNTVEGLEKFYEYLKCHERKAIERINSFEIAYGKDSEDYKIAVNMWVEDFYMLVEFEKALDLK